MSKTTIHDEIVALSDAKLLDWLKNGKKGYTSEGVEYQRDLTAQEMSVILARLKQVGKATSSTSATEALIQAAKDRNLKYTG